MGIPLSNRRSFLTTLAGVPLLLCNPAFGSEPIGNVTALLGQAAAQRGSLQHDLALGSGVQVLDVVKTGQASFLSMQLGDRTKVRLGADSELMIDQYIVDIGGVFDLAQGAMVFDRPEDAAPISTTVKSVFGQIGVRGTRFFAGPSRGVFGVFVERGSVEVMSSGEIVTLAAGDGVNLTDAGIEAPGVLAWGQARIAEAFASVGL